MSKGKLRSIKVHTETWANTKKAAALLSMSMIDFLHAAVMEKIERDLPHVGVDWEELEQPS